ncbi:MAG: Fic family protein [Thermoleophilia bacterium]|nr:Fic family protein [Thermoleophilia bacterium]
MAKVTKRRWAAEQESGLSRRDRQSCEYEVYIPDRLVGRTIALDGPVAADVVEAETAITRLNLQARALSNSEALARLLLRSESVASSKIEGLEVGARRLLRAVVARDLGEAATDVTASEVLGNIDAMAYAISSVTEGDPITPDLLLETHRRLLAGSRLEKHGGQIRDRQNWIGGSSFNPCGAVFVPPPCEMLKELLTDLCEFCNTDSLPAVAQAAIAHAQFETIHPFIDGNGRTGRALIHMVLRRRGVVPRVLPPVSLVLATWAKDYVEALTATRYLGPPTSPAAHEGLNHWVGLFAAASRRAVADASAFEKRIAELEATWRTKLGRVRANSATDLLLKSLPGAPILTVQAAASLAGRSVQAANEAVARLEEAGVLHQVTVGKRNRAFEARQLIRVFTDLERQLASPTGDTRAAPPSRSVPRRSQIDG